MDSVSSLELLKLVKRQELAWESSEAAVGHLERRLRLLERSESTKNSAIQIVEEGHWCRESPSLKDRGRDAEKELEISRLRADFQRHDLEMRRLKADLQRIKFQDFEDERSTVSDKFIDKINTTEMPALSRSRSFREMPASQIDLNASTSSYGFPADNVGRLYRNSWYQDLHYETPIRGRTPPNGLRSSWLQESRCNTPIRTQTPHGFLNESLATRKMDSWLRLCGVPDLDRLSLSPDCSKSSNVVRQFVSSLLATMQISVENLSSSIRMHDSKDCNSFKIFCGAIEDELFILKKTLTKLSDVPEEFGYQPFSLQSGNDLVDAEKLREAQCTIDEMMQQLAQTEFKVISLESSCIEKDKKVEDLEHRVYTALKDTELALMQKYELETTVREMYKEAKDQRHRLEELLSINEELLEFSQAKEEQLRNVKEVNDSLGQQLLQYEENCVGLNALVLERDKGLDDLNRRVKAGQTGTDAIIIEKIELQAKIQAMQIECEDQKQRIKELMGINEELLEYAQTKEQQVLISQTMETARLHEVPKENTEVQKNVEGTHVEVKETGETEA